MMYRLIVLNGPLMNQRISIEPSPMLIGRDPACHICVLDEEMARQHAQIEHREDGLYVTDLGSMNRILVNQREVREARLKHGDTVEIGRTRFLVQALVQAEVEGARIRARRRQQWRAVGVFIIVVLSAVVVANRWVEVQVQRTAAESAARAAEWRKIRSEMVARTVPPDVSGAAAEPKAQTPEDLEKVRQDLAALRETMKALTEKAQAAAAQPPTESKSESDLRKRCANLLAQSVEAIRRGQPMEADQLLAGALALDATFWPAYEERARLFERRGMPEEAFRQWNELIQRQPPPDVYERAVSERLRLGRAIRTGQAKAVRVASLEQRKVLTSGAYEEMRVLEIGLRAPSPEHLLESERIRVVVDVYDEVVESGRIERTDAVVNPRVVQWGGSWRRDDVNWVRVKYAVPQGRRGFRRYYGFVVQVFYNDRLQDVAAKPARLLDLVRAAGAPMEEGGSGS